MLIDDVCVFEFVRFDRCGESDIIKRRDNDVIAEPQGLIVCLKERRPHNSHHPFMLHLSFFFFFFFFEP